MTSFRFLFALLLAGLAGAFVPANAQRAAWQLSAVGGNGVNIGSLTHDDAGNAYISGFWRDSLTVGYTHLTDPDSGTYNVYIAKLDPAGRVQWVQRTDGIQGNTVTALAADHAGGLYVTGLNPRGFSIGAVPLDSSGAYLARLDAATGAVQWAHALTPPFQVNTFPLRGGVNFTTIAVDAANNLYLGGYVSGLTTLGGLPLVATPANASSGVVVKSTAAGVFTAVTQFVSFNAYEGASIAQLRVDPAGGLVVAGGFAGTVQFGTAPGAPVLTNSSPAPYRDAYITRLDAAGTVEWVKTAHVLSHEVVDVSSIALDAAGNTYAAGRAYGTISIDGTVAADSGQYVARLSRTGHVDWIKTFPGNERNNFSNSLTIGADGNLYSTGVFYSIHGFAATTYGPSTLYPFGITNLFVMCQDTSGAVRWARTRDRVSGGGSNNLGIGIAPAPGNGLYVYGYNDLAGTYDGHEVRDYSSFVLRLDPAAFIEGQVYLDQNSNGTRDANEGAFPRAVGLHDARSGATALSSRYGTYVVYRDTGDYQLTASIPRYYQQRQPAAPAYTGTLATYGQRDRDRDFGLAPIANQADVRVTLSPYSAARRGFVGRYRVRVENIGTTTATGLVSVALDPLLNYVGATPAPAQQTGSTVQWNLAALAPFGVRDFDLSLSVPLNVALGTVLRSAATVSVANDLDPTNDLDSLHQIVVGSWDPNALTVNYSTLTPTQVAAGTELDYLVQFQNLGTDTAFTVVLTDTLPAHLLQLGTLYVVSQSHNCQVELRGNNQLVVRFDAIHLPPNRVSALGSGGFIRFRVKPRLTLTPGALIPNTAHIFFDYNAPLATNDVATLVQTPNGLVAAQPAAGAFMRLYPNPSAGPVTVEGAIGARLTVLDLAGRVVRTAVLSAETISLADLVPGVYVVRLVRADGAATSRKLVVQP